MSSPVVADQKSKAAFNLSREVSIVIADSKGNPNTILADNSQTLPDSFELLKVGMWRTPYHGDIMIMPEDLQDYVDNFAAGVGVSGSNMAKLPINYGHDMWDKAAGWFAPAISDDGTTLMAIQVEWTPAAAQALLDGEWKCISAEFCPAGRGGWVDPLDEDNVVDNVLTGAALTNIPLMSQLKPIMASANFGKDKTKQEVFLITASENKEKKSMTLEEVTKIENDKLTDEQRTFLVDNKDSLNADQREKFGFEVSQKADENKNNEGDVKVTDTVTDTQKVDPEIASIAASIKQGTHVVVKADTLARLEETDKHYRQEKAESIVKAHVARGAIKADQAERWTNRLLASSGTARTELESDMDALPSNEILAGTLGSDKNAASVTAAAEVEAEIEKLQADNKEIDYTAAFKQVLANNKTLADRLNAERSAEK